MKKVFSGTFLVLTFVLGCESTNRSDWVNSMNKMADSYEELLPYMYSPAEFSDSDNQKYISLRLKQIHQGSAGLNKHIGGAISGDDPLFDLGINGIQKQLKKANSSFYVGEHEYSRHLLQDSLKYCNSCHLKARKGPAFIKPDQYAPFIQNISFLERAKVYIATREFEKAHAELLQGINDPKTKPTQRNQAFKRLLRLAAWEADTKSELASFLRDIDENFFDKETKKIILRWRDRLAKKQNFKISLEQIINQIVKKSVKPDPIQAVLWSTLLRDSLVSIKNKKLRAKIFYSLGKIYQTGDQLNLVGLPENYFQACIEALPYSKFASKCFHSLEYSMVKSNKKRNHSVFSKRELRALKTKSTILKDKNGESAGAYSGGEEL